MTAWLINKKRLWVACLIGMVLAAGGCEGTDTREKVDDTVEKVTGKEDLRQYQRMQKELEGIQKSREDRYRQLDPDRKDE